MKRITLGLMHWCAVCQLMMMQQNALLSCFAHIYPTLPFESYKFRVTALLKSRDWEISREIGTFSPLPAAPEMLLNHRKRTRVRLDSDFQTWHPQSFRGPFTTPASVSPRRQPASYLRQTANITFKGRIKCSEELSVLKPGPLRSMSAIVVFLNTTCSLTNKTKNPICSRRGLSQRPWGAPPPRRINEWGFIKGVFGVCRGGFSLWDRQF